MPPSAPAIAMPAALAPGRFSAPPAVAVVSSGTRRPAVWVSDPFVALSAAALFAVESAPSRLFAAEFSAASLPAAAAVPPEEARMPWLKRAAVVEAPPPGSRLSSASSRESWASTLAASSTLRASFARVSADLKVLPPDAGSSQERMLPRMPAASASAAWASSSASSKVRSSATVSSPPARSSSPSPSSASMPSTTSSWRSAWLRSASLLWPPNMDPRPRVLLRRASSPVAPASASSSSKSIAEASVTLTTGAKSGSPRAAPSAVSLTAVLSLSAPSVAGPTPAASKSSPSSSLSATSAAGASPATPPPGPTLLCCDAALSGPGAIPTPAVSADAVVAESGAAAAAVAAAAALCSASTASGDW
mmetsp:Transcript_12972/g.39256  ORF Transcript_12972/g.39256 Transcript_12972/m.39256 type:complete len:363 (-) Transcript_12972:2237-3325(-)